MKKSLLLIVVMVFCGCNKFGVVCSKPDAIEEIGIDHFQKLVSIIEQYREKNGQYPKTINEVSQNIVGKDKGYPNPKITELSMTLIPEKDLFEISFYFDREKTCLIGNNRACKYTSVTKKWSCY